MRPGALAALVVAIAFASCTTSYPYLVLNENCRCPSYVYKDRSGRFEVEVSAEYSVGNRVTSVLQFAFRNSSRELIDMRQGHIKGTSLNMKYEMNGRLQPLPFVIIRPGETYAFTLKGEDTEPVDDGWLKIAGEKVVVEIRGVLIGSQLIPPIIVTLMPLNPKLSS